MPEVITTKKLSEDVLEVTRVYEKTNTQKHTRENLEKRKADYEAELIKINSYLNDLDTKEITK